MKNRIELSSLLLEDDTSDKADEAERCCEADKRRVRNSGSFELLQKVVFFSVVKVSQVVFLNVGVELHSTCARSDVALSSPVLSFEAPATTS